MPLTYRQGSKPIFIITDECMARISGVISQGDNWRTAKVAAFYSAQKSYAVHDNGSQRINPPKELIMAVGPLDGKVSEFDFKVVYVLGSENVLADALSRTYSSDAPRTA